MSYLIYRKDQSKIRGRNNTWSSDMTKLICQLIGYKFSQFQALPSHFVNKKLKITQFLFRFQGNFSTK